VSVSIIIVNWNSGEMLRRCIASIAAAPPAVSWEIIVIDNASTDESVRWLQSDEARSLTGASRLRVIVNAENTGFSRANNRGMAQSQADMLLLLNPDTEVAAGAIDTLVGTLAAHERAALCGPRLLNPDGSLQPSVWPNPLTPWGIIVAGLGLWRLLPRRLRGEWLLGRFWNHDRRRAVPMLFGAAMLVRRVAVERVGGLDERFHLYAEDNEWCLRMTRAGWQVLFEPDAAVIHHGSPLSLQRWGSEGKLRVQLEAFFQFQRLCLSRSHRIANLAAVCVVAAAHRCWRAVRGRPAADTAIVFEMHYGDLKRALRELGGG
jgi:N-acetylglucosaminyl-diphospho-decaprenol L-rhamnosyltransferase